MAAARARRAPALGAPLLLLLALCGAARAAAPGAWPRAAESARLSRRRARRLQYNTACRPPPADRRPHCPAAKAIVAAECYLASDGTVANLRLKRVAAPATEEGAFEWLCPPTEGQAARAGEHDGSFCVARFPRKRCWSSSCMLDSQIKACGKRRRRSSSAGARCRRWRIRWPRRCDLG